MALANASIAVGATSLSVTGGTAKSFTPDGQSVTNGIHIADNAETDFRVKKHITCKNRNPVRQSDGSYGKGSKDLILTVPYLDGAGVVRFATFRYRCEYDPVIPAATIKDGRYMLAQALFDTDFENFHASGDIS